MQTWGWGIQQFLKNRCTVLNLTYYLHGMRYTVSDKRVHKANLAQYVYVYKLRTLYQLVDCFS